MIKNVLVILRACHAIYGLIYCLDKNVDVIGAANEYMVLDINVEIYFVDVLKMGTMIQNTIFINDATSAH